MQFLSNSQDILFVALAFCALLLTAFIVWLLYYAIMTIKQGYEAVSKVKEKIDAVDEVITLVKDKIITTSSYISLIVAGVKKVIEVIGDKKAEKKARGKK
jgi:succinate dehydrogenase hydrophobic anchor subunit